MQSLDIITGPDQAVVALQKTRRRLLAELVEPDSAAGLARKFGVPRQRLNYHLRELEHEGLVELVEERRKGNCVERVVRATARAFVISPDALGALGTTSEIANDRFSAEYLLGAAANAVRDVATLHSSARRAGKRLSTLTLEADVRFASAEDRAAFADELASAMAALVARYHDDKAPRGRRFHLLTVVHPASEKKS
ncbi:MAG TPA: helix-turn-helix domain-containing protein [Vicinamibacterales bacterium]|jgi:DNA-binding transcriptional ArsR family regulator|nr:helix-turn-helix domain-containing protein [Vicinamibacterales bacterium]